MSTVAELIQDKTSGVYTITPEDSVQTALEIMAEKRISSLPVVSDTGELRGIISERDYIRKAVPKRQLPWEVEVRDLMTQEVISVSPGDSLRHCMDIMSSHRIRHLPVIQDKKLAGMVSITDVLNALRSIRLDIAV